MKLVIHRGTHEIGGSCIELNTDSDNGRILIDFGMPLVNGDKTDFDWKKYKKNTINELISLGILPDIKGLYPPNPSTISSILLSHAHQDHYGFLQFIRPEIPIYMSTGTKSLIEVSNLFNQANINTDNIRTFRMWQPFSINGIKVTPYLMDHSAPDAAAFLIEADRKKIFYTGDFRGHGRKKILFERLTKKPPENIDYLIMEGSMIGREEGLYPDEVSVEEALITQMESEQKACFVFSSSQNLDRIVSVYRAAKRTRRIFVIDIYTAYILEKLSGLSPNIPQFDWADVRVYFLHHHAEKIAKIDKQLLYKYNRHRIKPADICEHPENKVILAKDNRFYKSMLSKCGEAICVYSMWNGYLKKTNLPEFLAEQNKELLEIHTSGHAILRHLKEIVETVKPKKIIPIHTFEPEKFGEMFENVIRIDDGQEIKL
ncbi:MBL fold metallo-hydrolase [Chloroflexota bacterium]